VDNLNTIIVHTVHLCSHYEQKMCSVILYQLCTFDISFASCYYSHRCWTLRVGGEHGRDRRGKNFFLAYRGSNNNTDHCSCWWGQNCLFSNSTSFAIHTNGKNIMIGLGSNLRTRHGHSGHIPLSCVPELFAREMVEQLVAAIAITHGLYVEFVSEPTPELDAFVFRFRNIPLA